MKAAARRPCIGVVAAMPAEGACLAGYHPASDRILRINDRMLLFISGIGASRARAAARSLLHHGASHLVSWGVAGALDERLLVGTLVIPEQVIKHGEALALDHDWRSRLCAAVTGPVIVMHGTLLDVPYIVSRSEDKIRLGSVSGALAADMESFAVARAACEAGARAVIVRAIVDAANQPLPAAATIGLRADGRVRAAQLTAHICKHPGELVELMRLGYRMRQARRTLRKVARVAPDFACSPRP